MSEDTTYSTHFSVKVSYLVKLKKHCTATKYIPLTDMLIAPRLFSCLFLLLLFLFVYYMIRLTAAFKLTFLAELYTAMLFWGWPVLLDILCLCICLQNSLSHWCRAEFLWKPHGIRINYNSLITDLFYVYKRQQSHLPHIRRTINLSSMISPNHGCTNWNNSLLLLQCI